MKLKLNLLFVLFVLLNYKAAKAQIFYNHGDTVSINSGTLLYLGGDMDNQNNGLNYPYLFNEGTLELNGDFSSSAEMLYTGVGSVTLGGSYYSSGPLTLYNMNITGGSTAVLSGNITISNSLNLSSGILQTNTDTITLDSAATLSETSTSYVLGNIRTQKYLGAGSSHAFGNIGLGINTNATAPGNISVVRNTGTAITASGNQSIKRNYTITPDNNTSLNADVEFSYLDAELNSINENELELFACNSGSCTELGYTSRDATANTVSLNGVNSFSTLTLGNNLHPLPVTLINFSVTKNDDVAQLNWQTAMEENNAGFDIEKSVNGKTFSKIGFVKGNGNSYTTQTYSFDDKLSFNEPNTIYYRLKQLDYNGKFAYSPVQKLILSGYQKNVKAWYNASAKSIEISIPNNKITGMATYQLLDMQGRLLRTEKYQSVGTNNTIQINMDGMAKSIYQLIINSELGTNTFKISN